MEEDTDVGPMIAPSEVERVQEWIGEALKEGAKLIRGGMACAESKALLEPTILSLVPKSTRIFREEAFAPVVMVNPYRDVYEVIDDVNDSVYGLQVGIFTKDLSVAWEFIKRVQAGGVMINEGPNFRVDHMPYGGVKQSGIGREGPRFAIEDYTEVKMVVWDLTVY